MGEEENKYVSQLKDVYDSCDTTGSGYLDKEELTELCHKLHLERQLPLLLETLLGNNHFARVNFEEFKEGFVTILSSSINLGLSDDESSYLEPVKPKYISGAKWYGRRTRPELQGTKLETSKYLQEQQAKVNVKSQLRRSASLESVESLKSDEEPESMKEQQHEMFEGQGRMCTWDDDLYDSPRKVLTSYFDMTENQVRDIWEDLGIGHNGYLNKQELATVCKNIGLKELNKEDLEELFSKLDSDGDGRVSLKEFQLGLFSHSPIPCPVSSTPHKPKHQKSPSHQIFKESVHRSATPSFISGSAALNLFSSIDDGSGFASPEQIASIWAQEGVENCKEILKGLDFNMEERVNLLELSMVLDDEIMASKNGLQQAAFASCKNELHHLEAQMEQISIERDRARAELEKVEKRNVQLFNEVDDNHTALEHHNESKLKNLEQDYKGKLTVMKFEVEMERELLLQQVNHQRTKLEADIKSLKEEESSLREKLTLVIKENGRLQTEVVEVAQKLSASEKQVLKLQKDLDFMLKDKLGLLDPQSIEFFDQEKRFAEIIKEYEVQCRDCVIKRAIKFLKQFVYLSTILSKNPSHVFLLFQVNYYEREIELMKRNFEIERKDIEQSFKIEISELEEQKSDLEELNVKYQEVIDGLKDQLQKVGSVQELKKRFEKERSEIEQNYAKEISSLGHRLAQERDRLEDDMKMKHETEMHLMRGYSGTVLNVCNFSLQSNHYREEIFQLNTRINLLSFELSELSSNHKANLNTISVLNQRLVVLETQKEHEAVVAKQLQEASAELTKEHLQRQLAWQGERALLEQQLEASREQVRLKSYFPFQFEKNAKSNLLLKDLYVENAQLMKTLQVAEQKQKKAENRNLILEEKISSLNKLIKEITLASQ
uniref:Ninein-like protein n=1 Tax=Varanus komodoensis TaxID=61221 RepID=A0A8D2LF43_VARKO